tara:strand:- start:150 stop:374 length:225 start_codon:yes stop_codon:yes gene_type:complete
MTTTEIKKVELTASDLRMIRLAINDKISAELTKETNSHLYRSNRIKGLEKAYDKITDLLFYNKEELEIILKNRD